MCRFTMPVVSLLAVLLLPGTRLIADQYDLFLLAGQSNMDGRGDANKLTAKHCEPFEDAIMFYKNHLGSSDGWQPLGPGFSIAPKFKGSLPSTTFGPEIGFARRYLDVYPDNKIALIKGSRGGTNLRSDWNPGLKNQPDSQGPRYRDFIETINQATRKLAEQNHQFAIRGLLWHQGESDSKVSATKHEQRLRHFVDRIREDLGQPDLPVILGEVFDNGKRDSVLTAIRAVAENAIGTRLVTAEGTSTWDDGTHFDAVSQLLLGKRYADAIISQKRDFNPLTLQQLAGKRVVWIGDSITYAGGYIANIELYLRGQLPDDSVDFVNVGLSSETVSGLSEDGHAGGRFPRPDLFERVDRVLDQTSPDILFACYGMNCGIYLPLNESRFSKFKDGIRRLHQRTIEAGARIIHLTPPFYDDLGQPSPYSDVLDTYSTWLLNQRDESGWEVIDLHFPMKQFLADKRKSNLDFKLQRDRVHPNSAGHWILAKAFLQGIGAEDIGSIEEPGQLASRYKNGDQSMKLITQRMQLRRDAWLTATKHKRPGVKEGLPLQEARLKANDLEMKIRGLLSN